MIIPADSSLLYLLLKFRYPALFGLLAGGMVGMPLPDETLLVFTGYLVSQNILEYLPAVIFAGVGSLTGMTVSYLLGCRVGQPLLDRFGSRLGLDPQRMDRVEEWFKRYGMFTLPIGYFVPGIRHLTAYSAGISRLPFRSFALYAYPGGLVWVGGFITLGCLLGESWSRFSQIIHEYYRTPLLLVILCVLLVAYRLLKKAHTSQ